LRQSRLPSRCRADRGDRVQLPAMMQMTKIDIAKLRQAYEGQSDADAPT
jgi:hypothetical protein